MLKNIHVKSFALIDEVEINLASGLNVLTGETGAGKSIIIDAVNFALGQRVSKDVVRDDAEYALSELVFEINDDKTKERLNQFDIPLDDNEVLIQRKITNGKSTARINGETVTLSTLKLIAAGLIDIHGQHDNQSLLSKASQQNLLDTILSDELKELLIRMKDTYVNLNNKISEYEQLNTKEAEKEIAFLQYELNEIDSASLHEGEDEALESDYKKMNNSKRIADLVSGAHRITGYDSEGAGSLIGRALPMIRQASSIDDDAKDLELILNDIDGLLNDFNRSIADYEMSLDFSDEDYKNTEDRLNLINSLKNKYGKSIKEILDKRDEFEDELNRLLNADEYKSALLSEITSLKKEAYKLCKEISAIRKKGANKLSGEIAEALLDLNFLDSQFEIKVTSDEENMKQSGYDDIEFFISTNPGEALKPLNQVASGGEMSRIMLAIKSVCANDSTATLIFDEIDTGISGRTAQKVSEKMSRIAKEHQVIVVTHLPQIAAMADTHFEISKSVNNGRTITSIETLSEEGKIKELARMLGGVTITEKVLENAKDMKKQADEIKNK
ncbi:MAG: DNA repair protein RecN [Lachnospiraceae bacterium]|nr:DNA repair protein RecN [Lachnospiraceae bacterium]